MAKSSAYTYNINPNYKGTDSSEDNSIHQVSPAWVLTFVRWNVRDTIRSQIKGVGPDLLQTRAPLVVENDCIQVSVSYSKASHTPSMSATLLITDTNYFTAIAPGDFVFVNMLNWAEDARKITNIARSNSTGPINYEKSGFKGVFKVQSVREKLSVDPGTGTKRVMVSITGFAFTEFNNSIYYNPYLRTDNQGTDQDNLLFVSNLGSDYKALISTDHNPYVQDILRLLIQSFIGIGVTDKGVTALPDGTVITANTHFYIPSQVGTFLGVFSAKAAKDIYNYQFGIQQYASSQNAQLNFGMNPSNQNAEPVGGRFFYTNQPCLGQSLLKAEYWNQQKAWDILNQYTNAPINELFTTLKIQKNGLIMPTIVFRQIPFNTDTVEIDPFNVTQPTTKFLNLPRWKLNPALVLGTELGRDEAARINFVQYYTTPPAEMATENQNGYISAQTASKNYSYDVNDVLRSGLRPMVITSSFQDLTLVKDAFIARTCAHILGDAVIGEHLKLNGTIETAGIVEPIAVGDNLEFDGNVYHIEEVNHICSVDSQTGTSIFRTVIRVSHGVDVRTGATGPIYAEMTHTNAYQNRKADKVFSDILPGVSEEQEVTYRLVPEPSLKDINKKDSPFVQPGQKITPLKKPQDE